MPNPASRSKVSSQVCEPAPAKMGKNASRSRLSCASLPCTIFRFELPELVTHQPYQFKSSLGQGESQMTQTKVSPNLWKTSKGGKVKGQQHYHDKPTLSYVDCWCFRSLPPLLISGGGSSLVHTFPDTRVHKGTVRPIPIPPASSVCYFR